MAKKLNCWEFRNCGREKNGLMAGVLGECPVPKAMRYDGLNGGQGAGRACWMICPAVRQSSAPNGQRAVPCLQCGFYQRVLFEEEERTVCKLAEPAARTA